MTRYLQTDKLHPSSTKLNVYPEVLAYVYIHKKKRKKKYINFNGVFNVSCIVVLTYCIGFILVMSDNIIFEHFFVSV